MVSYMQAIEEHRNRTDKEKLKDLLTEFGVEFEERHEDITCHEGDVKVDGYSCFYTTFTFDEKGAFVKMGAYE